MTGRRYIAYGSNLNRAQMALRCPDAKVVGTGEIKDYELLFRGNRNGAVATVEPKKGESVPVLIWEISPRDEFNLDRYEGYPRLYGKEMLEVEMDNHLGYEKHSNQGDHSGNSRNGSYRKQIQTEMGESVIRFPVIEKVTLNLL